MSSDGQARSGPLAILGHLRTARRLLVGFLVGAALLVAIGAVGLTRLADGQRAVLAYDRDSTQAIAFLSGANLAFEEMRLEVADVAIAGNGQSVAPARARTAVLDAQADAALASYAATDMRGRRATLDDLTGRLARYRQIRDEQYFPLAEAGRGQEAVAVLDEQLAPIATQIITDTVALDRIEDRAAAEAMADTTRAYEDARNLLVVFVVAAIILSFALFVRQVDVIGRLNADLAEQAREDPLTGLHNRRYMAERFGPMLAAAQVASAPLTVDLIDIDRFKTINDRYGHPAGDLVLMRLAEWIRQEAPPHALISRWGGEEFLLALPTDIGTGLEFAERLRGRCEHDVIRLEEGTIAFTLSVGVAGFPAAGTTLDELVGAADAALYEAKTSGRNLVRLHRGRGQ